MIIIYELTLILSRLILIVWVVGYVFLFLRALSVLFFNSPTPFLQRVILVVKVCTIGLLWPLALLSHGGRALLEDLFFKPLFKEGDWK